MSESLRTVVELIGGASLAMGLLVGMAKLWSILNRGNDRREDRASFQASIKALQEENARCWEAHHREREEFEAEIERCEQRIKELEEALERRRRQVHEQSNLIQAYIFRFGDIDKEV